MTTENKIGAFIWFDNQAESAAKFYTSIFRDSKIGKVNYYGKEGQEITGKSEGSVMTIEFQLENQQFVALNGGPDFKINPTISFFVIRGSKEEVDFYRDKLSSNPSVEQCGWLKDKFGVSWQIVPKDLPELLNENSEKSERVMKEMLQMKKSNIQALKEA